MKKYLTVVFLTTTIVGCVAPTPYLPGPTAHTEVKPDAILILNKTITIPGRSAGTRIQNGKIAEGRIDAWGPNCRFEVRDPAKTNQDIQPGEFTITQVGVEYHINDAAESQNMRTNFYLKSEKQPQVTLLMCQAWFNPSDARHLMLSEVEQAVGDLFTFQLKPAP